MDVRLHGGTMGGNEHDAGAGGGADRMAEGTVGRVAHETNNAVAFIVTHLHLLSEAIDGLDITEAQRKHLLTLADGASEGADRISDIIRRLKVLSWGTLPADLPESDDDTWDEGNARRRILVVDDEPYILAAIQRALPAYEVCTASGGSEAIAWLGAGESCDIVVCDMVMDDGTGIDVYRWLEGHRPELAKRTVFMSAGAFTSDVREFLRRVQHPVLRKPFDPKTLRWTLAQVARRTAEAS